MISPSRRRVRLWSPTPEQAEFLRAVEPTSRFLHNLPPAIRQQYAGQWIAARDSEIIAAAPTLAELCETLGDADDPTVLKLRLEKGVTIRWACPSRLLRGWRHLATSWPGRIL
jgi:hypothetical protein